VQSCKYYNSSIKKAGFHKSLYLYGFHRAKEAIRQTGIVHLVEGYKDCIAMHAAGFTNTVALMGTVLSGRHIELLQGVSAPDPADKHTVILLLDNDEAGQKASATISSQLSTFNFQLSTRFLPPGEDADSMFRKKGKKAFAAYMRMLLNPPGRYEQMLLAACLLHPEWEMKAEGAMYPFAEVVWSMIQTDDVYFPYPGYNEIMKHLAEGGALQALDDGLRALATETAACTASLQPDQKEMLLYLYYEERLQAWFAQATVKGACDDTPRRQAFMNRHDLYRHVSMLLKRPGAIL
jgi:DNA primase